jgi:hypothetical protein
MGSCHPPVSQWHEFYRELVARLLQVQPAQGQYAALGMAIRALQGDQEVPQTVAVHPQEVQRGFHAVGDSYVG